MYDRKGDYMNDKLIRILKSIIIFLLFVIIFAGAFLIYDFFKNQNPSTDQTQSQRPNEFLFLLAGVDSTGEDTKTRTDTLMLVKLDEANKNIDMISIPRDSYVSINGNMDKINAAHSYGGIDLTMQVVRDFMGINLDKYLVLSFDAVIAGIDALGGMDVDIDQDVANAMQINPGIHKMTGKEVLAYVRFRKGYTNADIGRIDTQQDFIKQFIKEVTKADNISKLPSVYKAMKPYIKTNISLKTLAKLGFEFKGVNTDNINTVKLNGSGDYINGISYYKIDLASLEEIRNSYLKSFLR